VEMLLGEIHSHAVPVTGERRLRSQEQFAAVRNCSEAKEAMARTEGSRTAQKPS
jgi:hypothetical protein